MIMHQLNGNGGNNSNLIKLKDFPRLFTEVVKGDYIIRDSGDYPLVMSEDDFERIFEVEE